MLLYDYFKWTNDKVTLENLWQNAVDCMRWIDDYGFRDGYVYYKEKKY